jgi:hypothetical protein
MKTALRILLVGLVLGLLPAASALGGQESESEKKAKEIVNHFLQALKSKDEGELKKIIDVPWLAEEERIINGVADLQKAWRQKFDKQDPSLFTCKTTTILSYAEFRKEIKEKQVVELLYQVLGKEGLVVMIGQEKPLTLRYILFRVHDGNAKIVGGPYRLTYLLQPNKIPDATREIFEKAEEFELISLNPDSFKLKPEEGFHGFEILGKTVVKNTERRKKLVSAFEKGVEESIGTSALCFNPRHGIRVTHNKKTVDFVICFECLQVAVFLGEKREMVLIADSPQPIFDQALRDAGVPLPAGPKMKK